MKATLGVRELVLDGELSPGDRVPEIALAQRLGVSRTPLRLALTTLAHEGLLESLPGGGFVVRSFTRAEEIGREHSRLALQNLDLVLEDHAALDRLEGAPLLARVV